MIGWLGSALAIGSAIEGSDGPAAWIWNAPDCEAIWNPEITLTSEMPMAAPDATATLAIRWVGLSTQTRRTDISEVPNPTVTCPSTNCMFTAVMSTREETLAGSEEAFKLICGVPVLGYVYVGGFCAW